MERETTRQAQRFEAFGMPCVSLEGGSTMPCVAVSGFESFEAFALADIAKATDNAFELGLIALVFGHE